MYVCVCVCVYIRSEDGMLCCVVGVVMWQLSAGVFRCDGCVCECACMHVCLCVLHACVLRVWCGYAVCVGCVCAPARVEWGCGS